MNARIAIALRLSLVTLALTGIVYPLLITGVATVLFPNASAGSLIYDGNRAIGSELIGQSFTSEEYVHSRPSANDYDAITSGPSNLGPTSAYLLADVTARVRAVRSEESLGADSPVPADLVCASASGLDPHISPESAILQAERVADARGIEVQQVLELIDTHTERATFGFIGEDRVNVLMLNHALDGISTAD